MAWRSNDDGARRVIRREETSRVWREMKDGHILDLIHFHSPSRTGPDRARDLKDGGDLMSIRLLRLDPINLFYLPVG